MNRLLIAAALLLSFGTHGMRHSVSVMMSSQASSRELLAEKLSPFLAPIDAALGINFDTRAIVALHQMLGEADMKDFETVALMKGYRNVLRAIQALDTPFIKLCREYTPETFLIRTTTLNPFHLEGRVAQKNNKPLVRKIIQLLETGEVTIAEINDALGQSDQTLLMVAAYHNDLALAKALLKAGATQHERNRYNALLLAIDNTGPSNQGNHEMVQLLLEAGANPSSNEGQLGYTALMFAAVRLNFSIIELLINAGADVHAKEKGGSTAYEITMRTLRKNRQDSQANVLLLDRIFGQAQKIVDSTRQRRQRPAQVIPQSQEAVFGEGEVQITAEVEELICRYGNELEILEEKIAPLLMTLPGYGVTVDAIFRDYFANRDEVKAIARVKGLKNVLNALQYLEVNRGQINTNNPNRPQTICNKCFKITNKRCAGCETAYYCSRECQVNDWKEHKPHCQKH